jgi:hypothetical protein
VVGGQVDELDVHGVDGAIAHGVGRGAFDGEDVGGQELVGGWGHEAQRDLQGHHEVEHVDGAVAGDIAGPWQGQGGWRGDQQERQRDQSSA